MYLSNTHLPPLISIMNNSHSQHHQGNSPAWSFYPSDLPLHDDAVNEQTLNPPYPQQHQQLHQRSLVFGSPSPSPSSSTRSGSPSSAAAAAAAHASNGCDSDLCAIPQDSWHVSHHQTYPMSNRPFFSCWNSKISIEEAELVSSSSSSSSSSLLSSPSSVDRFRHDCYTSTTLSMTSVTSSPSSSGSGVNLSRVHYITPSSFNMPDIPSTSSSSTLEMHRMAPSLQLEMHHSTSTLPTLSADMYHITSSPSQPLETHHFTPLSLSSFEIQSSSSSSSPRSDMCHITPSSAAAIDGSQLDRNSLISFNEMSTRKYGLNSPCMQGYKSSFDSTTFQSSRDRSNSPLSVRYEHSATSNYASNSYTRSTSWKDRNSSLLLDDDSTKTNLYASNSNVEHKESLQILASMRKGSIILRRWNPVIRLWCVLVTVVLLLLLLPLLLPPMPPPPLGLLLIPVVIFLLLIYQAISSPNLDHPHVVSHSSI